MENRKSNITIFYVIALLQGMVFYGPIATLYRRAWGLSVFDITLIESISLLVMIILEVPWGFIADRIGYKKTIVICSILFFISKLVFWKADGFALFLMERLILSVVLSGLSGCDSAYLYLSAGGKDSQKVFGIVHAMNTAGLVFAAMLFSMFIKNNYELAAFLTVLSYGAAMVLSFFLIEVKQREVEHTSFSDKLKLVVTAFGQNKKIVLFLIAAALLAESSQTITVFLNQLQYLRSGIPAEGMGYITILVTLAGMLSVRAYKLTERLGEPMAAKLLFSIGGAACAALALFTNPFISVLGIILLRAAASIFNPISIDIQNRQVAISDRATILSTYSIIMNMIAVGTNLVFGKIADLGVKFAMTVGAVFCFSGLILYMIWQRLCRE